MNKKKMIIILSSVVGVVLLVVIFLVVYNLIANSNQSYSQLETTLEKAARNYYKENEALLPIEDGDIVTVDSTMLVTGEYMKPLEELNDSICSGTVTVKKNGDKYLYTSYLDCGDDYKTTKLVDTVKATLDHLTDDGTGLYLLDNEYVYRGENPNNYITFAGATWRIVKIDESNNIALTSYNNVNFKGNIHWDNRYNAEKDSLVGINEYKLSRVRERLLELYGNRTIFPEESLEKIIPKNICIGKRADSDTSKDGSVECSAVLENESISLIPAYDFMNASLDTKCVKTVSPECQNYNYLSTQGPDVSSTYWLLTATTENSFTVYRVLNGSLQNVRGNSNAIVRPVIYLQDDVIFNGGTGTLANPYVMK